MNATRILLALCLLGATVALLPPASASPPCDPNDSHALVACAEGHVGDVVTCVRNLGDVTITDYPGDNPPFTSMIEISEWECNP